ncbi:MAG: ABC transporter permease [Bacteroidales bacterium]|nr:ABC transporter permease [Bacteroidales bacterium]
MITNYIKIAFRNFYRNKSISIIKILGLSLGLAVTFFILIYVSAETSYNDYNKNRDELFKVVLKDSVHNWDMSTTTYPMADFLAENFPDVKYTSRLLTVPDCKLQLKDESIDIGRISCVDSDFTKMFSLKLIAGNFPNMDNEPSSIVISKSAANKYFGSLEIINKSISIIAYDKETVFIVKAIFEDLPFTSTIRADFIGSTEFGMDNVSSMMMWTDGKTRDKNYYKNDWSSDFLETYVQITNPQKISVLETQVSEEVQQYLNENEHRSYYFQNIQDIYLESNHIVGGNIKGNKKSIVIFSLIAFLVLLIAGINYMILSTSEVVSRVKEFGIRKILGTNRMGVFKQISVESFLIILITIPLSFILIEQSRPILVSILEKQVEFVYSYKFIIGFIGILGFIVFIPALYMQYYINRILPVKMLRKTGTQKLSSKLGLRGVLIIIQYIIFIVLVVLSIGIKKQLNYAKTNDLGFNKDRKVIVDVFALNRSGKYELLKKHLLQSSDIENITGSMWLPPSNGRMSISLPLDTSTNENVKMEGIFVDKDFIETLGLKMKNGKSFNEIDIDPDGTVIVNESAVKLFGKSKVIGNEIWGGKIVGIVKDFKFHSVHEQIKPSMIIVGEHMIREMVIHFNKDINKPLLDKLKVDFNEIIPDFNLETQNLDDRFSVLYKEEGKLVSLISIFTFVAIFIASIGLLGITIFTTKKQTKNIAIRKVNGASSFSILKLLINRYTQLILLASFIGIPIAYFTLRQWLQDFAYRTAIEWWIFAIAAILALLISILTISWYSMKAARKNPVESLRYE